MTVPTGRMWKRGVGALHLAVLEDSELTLAFQKDVIMNVYIIYIYTYIYIHTYIYIYIIWIYMDSYGGVLKCGYPHIKYQKPMVTSGPTIA